ncbi:MAG: serine hydrolase domain-containing protein [Chromatocurvus sp.]
MVELKFLSVSRLSRLSLVLSVLGSCVLAGLAWLAWQLHAATQVAVGYSAKQLCSGVFVSKMPADFVMTRDILPRMAILGPALGLLHMDVDEARGEARATLLAASAVAGYQSPARGCTLHLPGKLHLSGKLNLPSKSAARATPADNPHNRPQPRSPFVFADSPQLMAALDAAFIEPAEGGRQTLAMLVAHRGTVVAERYAAPVTAATPLQGWSMNKSLLATWVALLVDEGRLNPDQPVAQRLRELGAPAKVVAAVSPELTLEHLLRMRSGFDFEERYGPGSDATRMLYQDRAMWQSAARTGHAHAPGVRFNYSSGDANLTAAIWQSALPTERYEEWLATAFALPLELSSLVAESDASGVQVGSSYAFLSARDWLTVGQLWLDAWHGRSALLPQAWQRAAVTPAGDDGIYRRSYGRGFWLNTGGGAFPGLPENLFYAGGNAGQYVLVLPDQELVVVRLGLSDVSADTGVHAFLTRLLNGLTGNVVDRSAAAPGSAAAVR